MSTDCTDICDLIIEIMCMHCPNYKTCQNVEDEANHDQMLKCLATGVLCHPDEPMSNSWPTEFEPTGG
jgi:hypothetical protein